MSWTCRRCDIVIEEGTCDARKCAAKTHYKWDIYDECACVHCKARAPDGQRAASSQREEQERQQGEPQQERQPGEKERQKREQPRRRAPAEEHNGCICNTSKLESNGYGFIKPDTGGENVFFHVCGIGCENVKSLRLGQTVKYTIGTNKEGRMCAQNIVSTESAKSSAQVPKVSAETTNFARYCRLLMDVGRDVLVAVFKGSYKKEQRIQWTESCGQSFLNNKFPDGASQRQLGKHLVEKIRAGKCEEWDITLLSVLLLNTPGYIKDKPDAKKAAQTLRDERNSLAHSADLLARQSLNEQEFNVKWETVKVALELLVELVPAEKEAHRSKIDEIATENFGQSALEPLFERVQQDIKHIQDLAEDASNKADEAMKKAENAASISQVHKAVDAKLESLMNQFGQVDQHRLPRDITLSNQKRYRLIKQVGKGAMGTVFEAKLLDSEFGGGKLALKICHADQSRAEREADIMKRLGTLKHENIVKFLDNALDDKHLVIVMELIEGTTLDEWLETRYSAGSSGVTLLETLPIVKQLAEGMAAVHAQNISHRDLKPGNLIFHGVTGKLVIVDFGLSKMHNASSTITSPSDQIGTLLYMSPEQINGDIKGISFPSDIWSIGIIWHEMLTNYTPFEPSASRTEPGSSSSRSQRRHFTVGEQAKMTTEVLKTGPRELPMLLSQPAKVPKAVTDTMAKCLNVRKEERFPNAHGLLNHLAGVFEELEKKREKLNDDGPQTPGKGKAKPFEQWSADDVCRLIKSIDGVGYAEAADVVKKMGINGKVFADMLRDNDEDLTKSIVDGGFGFKRMQLRVLKTKIEDESSLLTNDNGEA